jgi:hypothetical protein
MQIVQWLRDYSTVWMFAVFLITVGLVFWPGRKARFDRDAQIPLQDDR